VPLARSYPAANGLPQRIVLYRKPLEARASEPRELGVLVLDVIVEQLGQLWRMPPDAIDPGYGDAG
jgi:predicted Zn-dependent protease with MMP-like domain